MIRLAAWLGAALTAAAVVDRALLWASPLGLALALGGAVARRRALAAALGLVFFVAARCPREFRADSVAYFSYLRSLVFDHDLDFTNEWTDLGYPVAPLTETGHRANAQSLGPALLWSPFFLLAHFSNFNYPKDGYSAPYLGALAVGTLTIAVVGAAALFQVMARTLGKPTALVAVLGTILTSPILYYLFVVPTMAHGVTFGVASLLLWSWDRAEREPSLKHWLTLGTLLGLVTLCRWQAAVYGILVTLLAARGLLQKSVRPLWLLAAAGVAVTLLVPQFIAWKILFGRFFLLPQGSGYLGGASPYLFQTLFSANHGLFAWTPALFLGLLGLVAGLCQSPLLHAGAILVFLATAWVNGSVPAWDVDAGDAFGARRYDLVVPILALGLGEILALSSRVLARAPLLAPASALAVFALWNVGFIELFRERNYEEMAPLSALARDQAEQLHAVAKGAAGRLAGNRGRAWVYRFFSAEYFYTPFNRSGTIDLWQADERYLLGGWGSRSRRIARPPFRRALYPEACVRIPLEAPFDLRIEVTARRPPELSEQALSLAANREVVGSAPLYPDWEVSSFFVPASRLIPGENALCLRFGNRPPEGLGEPVAAEVTRVQLP